MLVPPRGGWVVGVASSSAICVSGWQQSGLLPVGRQAGTQQWTVNSFPFPHDIIREYHLSHVHSTAVKVLTTTGTTEPTVVAILLYELLYMQYSSSGVGSERFNEWRGMYARGNI